MRRDHLLLSQSSPDRSKGGAALRRRPWTLRRVILGVIRFGPPALADLVVVAAAYILAVGIRTGGRLDTPESPVALIGTAALVGVAQVLVNLLGAVYWRDWSLAALEDVIALARSTVIVAVGLTVTQELLEFHAVPYTGIVGGAALALIGQTAVKLRPRWGHILRATASRPQGGEVVIIVGAGRTGQLLARDLADGSQGYAVACFVDDDHAREGSFVRGIKVEGGIDDLPDLIARYKATMVVIAMAHPRGPLIGRVFEQCEGADVVVRAVTGLGIAGPHEAPIRRIQIEELLEREPVDLERPETRRYLNAKRVVVTGAAGSIGGELARQVAALDPHRLSLLDTSESGLHDLMSEVGQGANADLLLGDIRDQEWLNRTLQRIKPDVVFHAAAYKHVPIMETSPLQGIVTNVLGTARVLATCAALKVQHVVFVSSDKAVDPANVLGLTKRFGELLTIAYARTQSGTYSVVRFGNVLGSTGSVVPTFERQLDQGGPLTVTHPEATRYFMTIREAAGLVIEAGAIATSGDLLVLDMGRPVHITELARKMVRLRGLRPSAVPLEFVGLRPGEKLHERLYRDGEVPTGTSHPRVMRVHVGGDGVPLDELLATVSALEERAAAMDEDGALEVLRAAIERADGSSPGSG